MLTLLDRKLFQYTNFDMKDDMGKLQELRQLFERVAINPDYYLVIDSSSDLPYDFIAQEKKGRGYRFTYSWKMVS